MIREFILRCLYPPTTLNQAILGDRASRRALWSLGLTVEDLRAVDRARIERRRRAKGAE